MPVRGHSSSRLTQLQLTQLQGTRQIRDKNEGFERFFGNGFGSRARVYL